MFKRRLLLLLLLLPVAPLSADELAGGHTELAVGPPFISASINTPHRVGYRLGDRLHWYIDVTIKDRYQLDTNSLPTSEKRLYWFQSSSHRVTEKHHRQQRHYRIALSSQLRNSPTQQTRIVIPSLKLAFVAADAPAVSLETPLWAILATPLGIQAGQIYPEQKPPQKNLDSLYTRLAMWLFLAIGTLLLLFVQQRRQQHRPFAIAWRQLRKTDDPGTAAKLLHQAFNQYMGQTLFHRHLSLFFARYPQYCPLQNDITSFFHHSEAFFFSATQDEKKTYKTSVMQQLCRAARKIEQQKWST